MILDRAIQALYSIPECILILDRVVAAVVYNNSACMHKLQTSVVGYC